MLQACSMLQHPPMRFPLLSKVAAIGLVVALLALVLARIGALVDERSARQQEAVRSVQQSLAGAQTLLGPLIQRQCTESWDVSSGEGKYRSTSTERRSIELHLTPRTLRVQGELGAEARYRGLFKVNGYNAKLVLDAQWPSDLDAKLLPQREHKGSVLRCDDPVLQLAFSDVRGVRRVAATLDGQAAPVLPGTQHARYTQGVHIALPALGLRQPTPGPGLTAHLELDLVGTAALSLVPTADDTQWQVHSDWQHPSFGGRFLPVSRDIRADGFSAEWRVSSLASSAGADAVAGASVCGVDTRALAAPEHNSQDAAVTMADPRDTAAGRCLDTLDVAFIDPVNPYVLSDRATKYGMLFIGLTFLALALAEVLSSGRVRRVHPVQYALVGLALSLFFLLLLSLSEHLSFGLAYGLSSAACAALLAVYAAHALGGRRAGLGFGAGMGLLYGLVYLLLQQEQTALVIGSLGLFAAVAAVMWLTRRVNWYSLFASVGAAESQP
jgi:inner membrane protein